MKNTYEKHILGSPTNFMSHIDYNKQVMIGEDGTPYIPISAVDQLFFENQMYKELLFSSNKRNFYHTNNS